MRTKWDAYAPYDPGCEGPLQDLPRRAAKLAFEKLMAEKDARIDMLKKLLSANGLRLTRTDTGIQRLNDWFVDHVRPHREFKERLDNIWYSVVNDVALHLGDEIIRRSGGTLEWRMFIGPNDDVAYQRHVLMGFQQARNPLYNVDIDNLVASAGHAAIARDRATRERARSAFIRAIRTSLEYA